MAPIKIGGKISISDGVREGEKKRTGDYLTAVLFSEHFK